MPRGKFSNAQKVIKRPRNATPPPVKSESGPSEESFEIPNSANSESVKNGTNEFTEDNYEEDFSGEMSKLLEKYSTDMNKNMQAKRKKLEQFTQESTRTTTKKVLEINKNQSLERRTLIDHFQSQILALIEQGEGDLEKIKEAGDRLQKILVQQQKQQQQACNSHSQRIKAMKNLSDEFCKGMNELENSHVQQYSAVHNELRTDMALLQKKMLMEIQHQQMLNVRKSFKNMFA